MFQLSNLYTGKFSNIPKNLSVNHLYYAYDTRELYSFTNSGNPVLIISNDNNISIDDVTNLRNYLNTIDSEISGLTENISDLENTIINFSGDTQNKLLRKQNIPTGFITGLELSIKPGDPTKAIIDVGVYAISDFSDIENIQIQLIQVTSPIEFTPQYLTTNPASYIALDINMNVIQSASPFDNEDRRTLALIGATIHSNLTIINIVNQIKAPIIAPTNQLHDLIEAVGSLNLEGNIYSANGANLQINKSSGLIWGLGINAQNYLNPHRLFIDEQIALTFRYRLRSTTLPNGESVDLTIIDPDNYDNLGVKTIVPNNRFTVQRINLFQSGLTRIQYGQKVYNTLAEAKTLIQTDPFITEPNIAERAIFRAYLIIKKGVTNLSTAVSSGDADFIPVDKFGNVVGGAGVTLNFSNITTGLGYVPENLANKTDVIGSGNTTNYPSTLGVRTELDLKVDKFIVESGVTINSSGWTLNAGLYEYTYSNINITSNSIVDIIPDNSAFSIITTAQLLPKVDVFSGNLKIYSNNSPSGDFIITIIINKN